MSAPDIRRLGPAVLLQGQVLADLRYVLKVGLPAMARRDAVVPSSLLVLRSELARAIAEGGKELALDRQTAEPNDGVLAADEVAVLLQLRPRQIRNLAKAGRLPGRKIAGVWFLERAGVDEEIRRRQRCQ